MFFVLYGTLLLIFNVRLFTTFLHGVMGGTMPHASGDFVAFTIGGYIVGHGDAARLYDLETQARAQAVLLGTEPPDSGGTTLPQDLALYVYPPFVAWVFAGLAALSPVQAYLLWTGVNLLLLAVTVYGLTSLPGLATRRTRLLTGLAVLAFFPTLLVLIKGQLSFVMLALLTGTFLALRRERDGLAGIWLALGLVKPQLLVVPLLVLLHQRRWRALASFSLITLTLILLSGAVVGPAGLIQYGRLLWQVGRDTTENSLVHPLYMYNWRGTALRLLGLVSRTDPPPGQAASFAVYLALSLASVGLLLKAWRHPWADNQSRLDGLWGLTILVTMLVSPHLHGYDLSLWLLAGILIVRFCQATGGLTTSWQALLATAHAMPLLTSRLDATVQAQIGVGVMVVAALGLWYHLERGPSARAPLPGVAGIRTAILRAASGEWRWVLTRAAVILAVSCLPYLVAWASTPAGYRFAGVLVNYFDGYSYLAKMRQGWEGAWVFHLTYTPEPHDGAFIFLFYLGLGHLARLTGLPLILVYHGARVLAGLTLLVAAYAFLVRLTDDRNERRLAFWLVGTSAGLGWLGAMLGAFPIDLWVPEAFAFFSLLTTPHFPLAMALMLVVVAGVVWPARGIRRWLAPGLAALGLALVQPLALPVVYATLGLYLLLRGWRDGHWPGPGVTAAVGAALFSAPILLYDYRAYTTNPALSEWAAQNVTPAPSVLNLILGFGLVGLLAIPGGVMAARQPFDGAQDKRSQGGLVLVVWGVVTLVLVYVPFALQRRFLTGLGLPLAMLAATGLTRWLLPWCARRFPAERRAGWVSGLTVGLSALGNLYLLVLLTLGVLNQSIPSDLFARQYLSQDEVAAMQWLRAEAPDEVVLAAPRTGMLLPGQAGVRVFFGHPFETIDAEVKEAQAKAFFQGEMPADEWQALRDAYPIRYVFVGPAERALGGGGHLGDLEPAFRQGEVTIYRLP